MLLNQISHRRQLTAEFQRPSKKKTKIPDKQKYFFNIPTPASHIDRRVADQHTRMASNFAPSAFLSDRRIKRRYFQIPEAQKKLLEDDGAWSENLCRGQLGMLNVPAEVLQDVKDFHARKKVESVPHQSRPAQQSSPPSASRLHAPASPPQPDRDDEESGRVPWTPSPKEHLHPPPPELPAQVQSKRKIPPFFFPEEPSSSGAVSEALEIEAPGVLGQEMSPPVNKGASRALATNSGRPEPTPPSAQLPLGTVDSAMKPPPAKRRRGMDEMHASEGSKSVNPRQALVLDAVSKPPSGNSGKNQDSLTTTESARSLGPQPAPEKSGQSGMSRSRSDPAACQQPSSLTQTWEGRRQEEGARELVHMESPTPGRSIAPPPAQRIPVDQSPLPATGLSQNLTEPVIYLTPYESFKLAYPDYSENCRKFVSACLSVNQLRRDRQLPEFLYDDFVRAYSSDYLIYVSECSRKKADKILPGIQWYNEYVKDVQYTKKLIQKDNLAALLALHKEEAHSVRRSIGYSQSTASESGGEESDKEMLDASGEEEEEQGERELVDLEVEEAAPPDSPELLIQSPGRPKPRISSKSPLDKTVAGANDTPQARATPPTTADARQDEPMQDAIVEEEDRHGDISLEVDRSRDSAELPVESPSAVKAKSTATPIRNSVSRMHKTPITNESLATQETKRRQYASHDSPKFLRTIESSPPSRESAHGRGNMAVQAAPVISSPQTGTRQVLARQPHELPVDEDGEEDEEDAFDPPMPLPPPKKAARSSPIPKKTTAASAGTARPASTSTAHVADESLSSRREVTRPISRRASNISGAAVGRPQSPASSERSYANVPRSKKRVGESPAERARNLKAFIRKRLSAGTPTSTSNSRQ